MSLSTPPTGASIPERLIAAVIALVSEGDPAPSVRKIAERAGRTTICVYSDFGGRRNLVEAAHRRAAEHLLATMEGTPDPAATLETWLHRDRELGQWLFSREAPEGPRAELIDRLRSGLGDSGTDRLAITLGRLLLST